MLFIIWIEILLKDQLSRVINSGTTTLYFNLDRSMHQGDLISAYLFILTLLLLFLLIKKLPEIKFLEIFVHCFLYTAYGDGRFFLKDSQSIAYIVGLFNTFFVLSRIQTKSNKMEIARIRALKREQLAVCCMK